MGKITNHNNHKECLDLCCEKYCSELATHFFPIGIKHNDFLITMCHKHYLEALQ